jgi:hypothetical protein
MLEVFGFPIDNMSDEAHRHRDNKLCPFHNKTPKCTKVSATNPLGVCSLVHQGRPVIICPVRVNEDWKIIDDAADFFFAKGQQYTPIPEVRIKDVNGDTAGNIDFVLAAHDRYGQIYDFGAIEVQTVYISGTIRPGFEAYMEDPETNQNMDWNFDNPPRPDFLSSSRKRLAPQLLFKGGILHSWGKKQAIIVDEPFFNQLPAFEEVSIEEAELAFFIYNLQLTEDNTYELVKARTIYTKFEEAMETMTKAGAGAEADFVEKLEEKLKKKLKAIC